jgi:hypothetical protein
LKQLLVIEMTEAQIANVLQQVYWLLRHSKFQGAEGVIIPSQFAKDSPWYQKVCGAICQPTVCSANILLNMNGDVKVAGLWILNFDWAVCRPGPLHRGRWRDNRHGRVKVSWFSFLNSRSLSDTGWLVRGSISLTSVRHQRWLNDNHIARKSTFGVLALWPWRSFFVFQISSVWRWQKVVLPMETINLWKVFRIQWKNSGDASSFLDGYKRGSDSKEDGKVDRNIQKFLANGIWQLVRRLTLPEFYRRPCHSTISGWTAGGMFCWLSTCLTSASTLLCPKYVKKRISSKP